MEVRDALLLLAVGAVVAGSVYFTIRDWRKLPPSQRARSTGVGDAVEGLLGCLGGLAGCLFYLVVALVGLFFMVWLVKRMWEAA
ncbi:MAG TPA: hypothetical protein VGQ24_07660, partial [Gemmatimonadales bacterium]|nr:hypothetical protein [Gemmatimonadales bacterium]